MAEFAMNTFSDKSLMIDVSFKTSKQKCLNIFCLLVICYVAILKSLNDPGW